MNTENRQYTELLQHVLTGYITWLTSVHNRCDIVFCNVHGDNDIIKQYGKSGYVTLNFGGMGAGDLWFDEIGMRCTMSFDGKRTDVFVRYDEIVGIRHPNGTLFNPTVAVVLTTEGEQPIRIAPDTSLVLEEIKQSLEAKIAAPKGKATLTVVK